MAQRVQEQQKIKKAPWFVLSPCGTSVLTNNASSQTRALVIKYSNVSQAIDIPDADRADLEQRIDAVRSGLEQCVDADVCKQSAELHALWRLYAGVFRQRSGVPDGHYLLCTDTWLGEETGKMISAWLQSQGIECQYYRQKDLQTNAMEAFQSALADLARFCADTIPAYRDQGFRIIFNLTGGFKSVQGFLQILGMFYADEMVYIFESGSDLLRIPRLPLRMDAINVIQENLIFFRRFSLRLKTEIPQNIPELFLLTIGGESCLSAWGEIILKENIKKLYRESFYPPPSKRIIVADEFYKQMTELPGDRLEILNHRMDDLARFLETEANLKRLHIQPLSSSAKTATITHEFNAWSDHDARRVYGRLEGNKFYAIKLDKHL